MAEYDLGTAKGTVELDTSDVAKAEAAVSTFGSSFGKSLDSAGKKMTAAGKKMTTHVTLPLVALGAVAVKTATDFEKTMNTMEAVAGVPGPELEKLRKLAIQLGADTVFSANEAGQAMLELAKAGISTSDIMGGALANTLDLATAGDLELAEAATIAANAMNTFKLSGEESKIAVDALAGSANASSADVADLAQALAQGSLAAKLAGLDIQETTAVLGAFADNGIRGSDAGTSLKTMLLRLIPVTTRSKEAMKKLGLDFQDAQGNILPITEIFEQLQQKMGPLSEAQRNVALQTIFGTDAFRAAAIASELGAEGLEKYLSATEEVGAASKVAEGKMKGLPGVIEELKGSFETFLLTVGDDIAPVVKQLGEALKDLLNEFAKLDPGTRQAILKFALIALVAGPLLRIFGPLVSLTGRLAGAFGKLAVTAGGAQGAAGAGAAKGIVTIAEGLSRFAKFGSVVTVILAIKDGFLQLRSAMDQDWESFIQRASNWAEFLTGIDIPELFPEPSDPGAFEAAVLQVSKKVEKGKLTFEEGAAAVREYAEAFKIDIDDSQIANMLKNAPTIERVNALLKAQTGLLSADQKALVATYIANGQWSAALDLLTNNLEESTKGVKNSLGPKQKHADITGRQAARERELAEAQKREANQLEKNLRGVNNITNAKRKEADASTLATQKSRQHGQQAEQTGNKMDGAGRQAENYKGKLDKIPPNVRTDVSLNSGSAEAAAARLKALLEGLERTYHARVEVIQGGSVGSNARGTRDWEGGLTLVGERGPELVVLPKHAAVIPSHILRGIQNSRPIAENTYNAGLRGTPDVSGFAREIVPARVAIDVDGVALTKAVDMRHREQRITLGRR